MGIKVTVHFLNGEVVEGTITSDYLSINLVDKISRGVPFNMASIGGIAVKTIVVLSKNINYVEVQEQGD